MREIRTSGSTRGRWVADLTPLRSVLLYRSSVANHLRVPFTAVLLKTILGRR